MFVYLSKHTFSVDLLPEKFVEKFGVGNKWIFAKQVNNNEIRAKSWIHRLERFCKFGETDKKTDTNEEDRCWRQQRQNVWQHSECCCVTNATIICIISHILIHLCSVILSPLVRFFPWFFPQHYIHHHNTYTIEQKLLRCLHWQRIPCFRLPLNCTLFYTTSNFFFLKTFFGKNASTNACFMLFFYHAIHINIHFAW